MSDSIRVAIAGLGTATRLMLRALMSHPNIEVVAAASVREAERNAFARDFSIPVYADIDELSGLDSVDAIYIATPTHLHVEHVLMTLERGKHVLVEKPLAADLSSAQQMVEAAEKSGRVVIVGHSHSFDAPIQAMRDIVQSGEIGGVRMIHNWCYTDWLYRPRHPAELSTDLGGGVTFRQGAHQFDVIRYLGGGALRSVRASTGHWDASRPTEGSHTVYLEFEDGVCATAVYSGYDRFHSAELTFGIGEWGHRAPPSDTCYGVHRKRSRQLTAAEESVQKCEQSGYRAGDRLQPEGEYQPFFGLTLISCERGDIRQGPHGLFVYAEDGILEVELASTKTPHDKVVEEFVGAINGSIEPVHTARWGMATLEVCLAVLESAKRREEIYLHYQFEIE